MQNMKTTFHLKIRRATLIGTLAILPAVANAQGIALSVGSTIPMQDVLGRNWTGNNGDPDNSSRVEIRRTWTGGIILAPTNGPSQIDTFNPLITNSHLGRGVIGVDPGIYAETFTNRNLLATNLTYYARVYDRPDSSASIYYADTAPFFGPPAEIGSINPEFGARQRVDGEADVDTDGEGLPDAMEGDMGLDAGNPDTDEDGYNDYFEALYDDYLHASEPDPSLSIQINRPLIETDPYTVSWWTIPVPDMTYQLQYRPQQRIADEDDGYFFSNVWVGAATETLLDIDVQDWVGTNVPPKGFFRVTVPYQAP